MRETRALIEDATGLVENIIVVDTSLDGPFDPGPGKTLMDAAGAEIGGKWDGGVFQPKSEPPPPAPTPEDEMYAAIAGAGTLEELKAALLGQSSAGKVAGRTA